MYKTSSNFRVSYFRNRVFAWMMLTVLCCSFMPSVSIAQQPTATIKMLSGNVLASGQAATVGTALRAGDTIQTQAGASVVLELSDGSELHLGENTEITLTDLSQTATGARVSLVKLMWGRIRATLSPGHQQAGSSFNIETPNALVGVKFSEPDIEVSYSLEKAETVGIAHTVELLAKNLVTDEEVFVPVGSSVIITAVGIKVIAGIIGIGGASSVGSTGTGTASTTTSTGSTGMGTGTKVVIGAGAVAAAGGVAALAASSGNGDESNGGSNVSFTGTFARESSPGGYLYEVYTLVQNGSSVTGNLSVTSQWEGCDVNRLDLSITGTVNKGEFSFYLPFDESCASCNRWDIDSQCTSTEAGNCTAILLDGGRTLVVDGPGMIGSSGPYIRQ